MGTADGENRRATKRRGPTDERSSRAAIDALMSATYATRTIAADVEYWPTPDPSDVLGNREQTLDAYRAVRDQLQERIKARFDWRAGGRE